MGRDGRGDAVTGGENTLTGGESNFSGAVTSSASACPATVVAATRGPSEASSGGLLTELALGLALALALDSGIDRLRVCLLCPSIPGQGHASNFLYSEAERLIPLAAVPSLSRLLRVDEDGDGCIECTRRAGGLPLVEGRPSDASSAG